LEWIGLVVKYILYLRLTFFFLGHRGVREQGGSSTRPTPIIDSFDDAEFVSFVCFFALFGFLVLLLVSFGREKDIVLTGGFRHFYQL
jgi:hypothetical protein